jgi:predicted site-specific integrase-resolvase
MGTMTNETEWITRKKTAEILNLSVTSVDYRVKTGKITEYRDGLGRLRFNRAEIEKLLTPVAVVSSDR